MPEAASDILSPGWLPRSNVARLEEVRGDHERLVGRRVVAHRARVELEAKYAAEDAELDRRMDAVRVIGSTANHIEVHRRALWEVPLTSESQRAADRLALRVREEQAVLEIAAFVQGEVAALVDAARVRGVAGFDDRHELRRVLGQAYALQGKRVFAEPTLQQLVDEHMERARVG